MSSISYRLVEFDEPLVKYEDLTLFRPSFITPGPIPGEWYYLGPVATSPKEHERRGLIVKANDPTALDEVEDWAPVFIDIEGGKFSTWRGIARKPGYTVIGHFFVTGVEKPTPEQTARIKAIRNDLISEQRAENLIWKKEIPFAALSLWNKKFIDMLHVPTGAFVSKNGNDSVGLEIGVIRFGAQVQEAW